MDANIENNNEDEQEAEQERIAAAAAATAAAARRRRLQLISVLEGFDGIPFQTRNKTDELVEEFLGNLEEDVHDMLCDNNVNSDNYRGLDSDRDTEAEVETIIRVFPDVLTRRGGIYLLYPIQCLAFILSDLQECMCNLKAVSFIPLVAMLAIEFGWFQEQDRGGLLCQDEVDDGNGFNVLQNLLRSDETTELHNQEHHEAVDDKYFQVLIQLRQMDLLKKEDIQSYNLLHSLYFRCHYFFTEMRFRFLVEWDPNALTQTDEFRNVPLQDAACNASSIKGFQITFENGIKYFPKKKGINLLFHINNGGRTTPFQFACKKYGREKVMEVVEDTLARYSDDTPITITEALAMAAIDENIHLDCVYFLLRRQPDVLVKLHSNNEDGAGDNKGNDGNNGKNNVLVTDTKDLRKKRKREQNCDIRR
jgi:hypothetical protein